MSEDIIGNRYKVEKGLGSGVCGTAFLTTDLRCKTDEKLKVVKKIYVGSLMLEETVSAAHEGNVLKNLNHQNILKFYDSFIDREFYCIVTEFCDEGDLDLLIQSYRDANERIDEDQIMDWLVQILLAVQYIHLRNILHRDLKTKNIFLKNNQVKLGDFGISKLLANPVDMAETFVGTPFYMSPEVLRHDSYNSKSDIWSVGCILYDLVALEHPFKGTSLLGVVQSITSGSPPAWPSAYSTGLKQVFLKLIESNQSSRPSATEALAIPYLANHIQVQMNASVHKKQELLNSTTVVRKDKQNLAENVQRRMKLEELKKEAEEKLFRNLLPRDRMRVTRQRKADAEAQRLKSFVAEHHREVQAQYTAIRNSLNPYLSNVNLGDSEKPTYERNARSGIARSRVDNDVPGRRRKESLDLGSSRGNSFDDFDASRNKNVFRWTTAFEETPITPMKDVSIYKMADNSKSFDDGIPENPELAETYYGQFDDFYANDVDSDSSDDSFMENLQTALALNEQTIVKKN